MSEMDRAPLIRVQVDQEVFVDSVHEGDEIEDATVATEVTSFDRVGDAFVLEGAIVFAGYAKRARLEDDFESNDASRSNLDFSEGVVHHLHHRMPFFLRVPVKSQPRGLVNVASRIAQWNLKVIEAGWVHVTADLNIVGLNGQEGYHFQCGAQEVGDILFGVGATAPSFEDASESKSGAPFEELSESFASMMRSSEQPQEESRDAENAVKPAETRGEVEEEAGALAAAETLSEARGGQILEEETKPNVHQGVRAEQSSGEDDESTVTEQLADFDRVFDGSEARAHAPEEKPSAAQTSLSPYSGQGEGSDEPTWAEFDFEHQLSTSEGANASTNPLHTEEQFVPSRSFSVEGFHAASGFVPSNVGQPGGSSEARGVGQGTDAAAVNAESILQTTELPADGSEVTVTQGEDRGESAFQRESLWSFVDFNAPERAHTLRFVVVQEEETLGLVAERVGCSKSDLIRVNELRQDTVEVGQLLMVPTQHKSIVH